MCNERESLAGKRFAAFPQALAGINLFIAVSRSRMVEHLRRRLEPPGRLPIMMCSSLLIYYQHDRFGRD